MSRKTVDTIEKSWYIGPTSLASRPSPPNSRIIIYIILQHLYQCFENCTLIVYEYNNMRWRVMWLRQSVVSQMQVEKYVLDEQVHLGVSRQNQVKYTGMLLFEAPFSSTPV